MVVRNSSLSVHSEQLWHGGYEAYAKWCVAVCVVVGLRSRAGGWLGGCGKDAKTGAVQGWLGCGARPAVGQVVPRPDDHRWARLFRREGPEDGSVHCGIQDHDRQEWALTPTYERQRPQTTILDLFDR